MSELRLDRDAPVYLADLRSVSAREVQQASQNASGGDVRARLLCLLASLVCCIVKPKMLDLCCGLQGASKAMRERGWDVLAIDTNEALKPDVVASIVALPVNPYPLDLLWCSPPCLEYSRYDQPWFKPKVEPDQALYRATLSIIDQWQPRYWIIENVRGAIRWWGRPAGRYGSHYIWTNLPLLPTVQPDRNHCYYRGPKGDRAQLRAVIPYELSLALAELIETVT